MLFTAKANALLLSLLVAHASSAMVQDAAPQDFVREFDRAALLVHKTKVQQRVLQIRANRQESSTPLSSLKVQEEALQIRMKELIVLPQAQAIIDQQERINEQLAEIARDRAALLHQSVPKTKISKEPANVIPSRKLHKNGEPIYEAATRRREAHSNARMWLIATVGGISFTALSYKCNWWPEKVTLGSGIATGIFAANAARWYLKGTKEQALINQLRK